MKKILVYGIAVIVIIIVFLFMVLLNPNRKVKFTILNRTTSNIQSLSISTSDKTSFTEVSTILRAGEQVEFDFNVNNNKLVGDGSYLIEALAEDGYTFSWKHGYYSNGNIRSKAEYVELSIDGIYSSSLDFDNKTYERNNFVLKYPNQLIIQTGTREEFPDEGKFFLMTYLIHMQIILQNLLF